MIKLIVFYVSLMIHQLLGHECFYEKRQGLFSANCPTDVEEVPYDLDPSIEGLYFYLHKIQSLRNTTFSRYSSLRRLYMGRNSIKNVESYAFAPLTNLQVLNISGASVDFSNLYLPTSLLELYLEEMGMQNVKELPFSSLQNLKILSLKRSLLVRIPSFGGVLPSLEKLDVRKNDLPDLKIDHLAPLCKLKYLNIGSIPKLNNPCECVRLKKWIMDREIKVDSLSICTVDSDRCDTKLSKESEQIYGSCIAEDDKRTFDRWLLIGCCVAGGVFSVIVLYFCCTRRKTLCRICCCRKKKKMISVKA